MRKLIIGFVSLAVVLVIFLLYSLISQTPQIDINTGAEFIDIIADSNITSPDSNIGMIGNVGVGTVQKAKYVTLNKNKQVEREFGFEKLLHEAQDIWEIQKPYLNVYQRSFKCHITADKGMVKLETAVGRSTPKDATFTGNVVVHILPEASSKLKESVVYLDELVFLSERSQLSTAGPVRFVSKEVQMLGTGMELVYNDQMERLEFFRIIDLESLRIKNGQVGLLSSGKTAADKQAEAASQEETKQSGEPTVVIGTQEPEVIPTDTQPQVVQKQGQYYKCVFSKNVVIDTPEQLIFADERVSINDIFWSKATGDKSDKDGTSGTDSIKAFTETTEKVTRNAEETKAYKVGVSTQSEPNKISQKRRDIVVTCDGGVVLLPIDSPRAIDDSALSDIEPKASSGERPEKPQEYSERTRFFSERIDYNATTKDVVAKGLSEFTFYMSDVTGAEANEVPVPVKITAQEGAKFDRTSNQVVFEGDCLCTMPQMDLTEQKDITLSAPKITLNIPEGNLKRGSAPPDIHAAGPVELIFHVEDSKVAEIPKTTLPVTVTAQKQARFSTESNQVIFEGDSLCTMLRKDPNTLQRYTLSAPKLTVDLIEDANDRPTASSADIKHLTADGGLVKLRSVKSAGQKLLSGIELECSKFEFDPNQQLLMATGPGEIKLNNSEISESKSESGRFSLRRPCWAFLENFDTLKYFIQENRIAADAGSERLLINYIPVVDGQYDEQVTAAASHIEAILYETAEGQRELSALLAIGRIDYEDKDNRFLGSELFYDYKKSVITVKGDESAPCYYNGVLVDGVIYNLRTGKVEAKVVGPGSIQINR